MNCAWQAVMMIYWQKSLYTDHLALQDHHVFFVMLGNVRVHLEFRLLLHVISHKMKYFILSRIVKLQIVKELVLYLCSCLVDVVIKF